jgi:hypothetical protein
VQARGGLDFGSPGAAAPLPQGVHEAIEELPQRGAVRLAVMRVDLGDRQSPELRATQQHAERSCDDIERQSHEGARYTLGHW